jgi:acylphosphatase
MTRRAEDIERRRIVAGGRVQGVGFRYFCRDEARAAGVRGWVRNRPDGSVELEAEAAPAALETFFARVKTGHPWARVVRWDESTLAPRGDEAEGFDIAF